MPSKLYDGIFIELMKLFLVLRFELLMPARQNAQLPVSRKY